MKIDTEDEEHSVERTYNDDEEEDDDEEEKEEEEEDDGSTEMEEEQNVEEVKSVNIPNEDGTYQSFEEILNELGYDIQNDEDYERLRGDVHSFLLDHMNMDGEQWTQVESSYKNSQKEGKSALEGLKKRHDEKQDVIGNMVEKSLKDVCEQNQKLKKQNKSLWRMCRKQLRKISKLEEKLKRRSMRIPKQSVQPASTTFQPLSTSVQPASTTVQPASTTLQPPSTLAQPPSILVQPTSTTAQLASTTDVSSSNAVISAVTALNASHIIFNPSTTDFSSCTVVSTPSTTITTVKGAEEGTKKNSEDEKIDEGQEPNNIVTEIANMYEKEFGERQDFSRSGIKKRVKSRTDRKKTEMTGYVVGNNKMKKSKKGTTLRWHVYESVKYINEGHLDKLKQYWKKKTWSK